MLNLSMADIGSSSVRLPSMDFRLTRHFAADKPLEPRRMPADKSPKVLPYPFLRGLSSVRSKSIAKKGSLGVGWLH